MADDIHNLLQKLKLKEPNHNVTTIKTQDVQTGIKANSLSLIGKLVTNKDVHAKNLQPALEKSWLTKRIKVIKSGFNLFQIQFEAKEEMYKVLHEGPWCYDNCLLNLKLWSPNLKIDSMEFQKADFWVQVKGLPSHLITVEVGKKIATNLADCAFMQIREDSATNQNFFRFKTSINLLQPLPQILSVNEEDNPLAEPHLALYQYEKLPTFCYFCGCLGHSAKTCPEISEELTKEEITNFKFGQWLNANKRNTLVKEFRLHDMDWKPIEEDHTAQKFRIEESREPRQESLTFTCTSAKSPSSQILLLCPHLLLLICPCQPPPPLLLMKTPKLLQKYTIFSQLLLPPYLWSIQTPPKIRSFLWSLASNATAFGSNLLRRKITDGVCPICKLEVETWQHCFFRCKWIRVFWRPSSDFSEIALLHHGDFIDLCLFISKQTLFDFETFAFLLWHIWCERNRFVFEGVPPSFERIQTKTDAALQAYQIALKAEQVSNLLVPFQTNWIKPLEGTAKLNVDAGVREGDGTAGIILRDWEGKITMAVSLKLGLVTSVEEAECLAIYFGLIEAARIWSGPIHVESDSSSSIARFNSEDDDFTHLGSLVLRTKRVCSLFHSCYFFLISRNCNRPADLLAKLGFTIPTYLSGYCNWGINPPETVISATIADLN